MDESTRKAKEQEAYMQNLATLVSARTEQLRTALNTMHELVTELRKLNDPRVDEIIQRFHVDQPGEHVVWGKAGEAAPAVDPEDLKAVWRMYEECRKAHPGE